MKSRVHPKYKTKYHVGNWSAYDRALVQRGDITVWLAPDAIATWEAVGGGTRGGQRQYSDLAIETARTLRLIVHLPLRQTEGFLTSIFRMLGLDLSAPDHTTLSRRGQSLDLPLRRAPAGAGLHLLVDSTGLSIVGEGEEAAVKHGGRGRRGWKTRAGGTAPRADGVLAHRAGATRAEGSPPWSRQGVCGLRHHDQRAARRGRGPSGSWTLGRRPDHRTWQFRDRHIGRTHHPIHDAAPPASHGRPWPTQGQERSGACGAWRRSRPRCDHVDARYAS